MRTVGSFLVVAGLLTVFALASPATAAPERSFDRPDDARELLDRARGNLKVDLLERQRPERPRGDERGGPFGLIQRPTGLSVSVVSTQGNDVIVDVTMTSTNAYTPWHPGRLGNTFYYTLDDFYGPYGPYPWTVPPGTTTTAENLHFEPGLYYGTYHFLVNTLTVSQNFNFTFYHTHAYAYGYDGQVPGLDFGDGSVLEATTLPLVSSTMTGGGSVRRTYRGTFSHTYSDDGIYTVRAASAPAPTSGASPGTILTASAYPVDFVDLDYGAISHFDTFTFADYRLSFYSTTATSTTNFLGTYFYTGSSNTAPFALEYIPTVFSTVGAPAQLVATAAVDVRNILEVPTASTWGLLALGGLLAGAGLILLRRS